MKTLLDQYHEAKEAAGDALLLFRIGDFYEAFGQDAKDAAALLGLSLTTRDRNSANPLPMAGFPYHHLDAYVAKLVAEGRRVAVSEPVAEPIQPRQSRRYVAQLRLFAEINQVQLAADIR